MTTFQAAILGFLQGLTEFLPISGSGHLALFQHWFGLSKERLGFEIAVNFGTLFTVLIYFAGDIQKILSQTILFLIRQPRGMTRAEFLNSHPYALTASLMILSSLVTVLVSFFLRELFEFVFRSVLAVGIAWLMMGTLLVFSNRIKCLDRERDLTEMHHQDAFFIGLAQGLSFIPGLSQSGASILMGLHCGLTRHAAARYSFLLGIPAVLSLGFMKINEGLPFLFAHPEIHGIVFLCAMISSFLAIRVLLRLLELRKFYFFGFYCLVAGAFAIASQFLKL